MTYYMKPIESMVLLLPKISLIRLSMDKVREILALDEEDIGKEERLNLLQTKREFLDLELAQLNQQAYKTYRATVYEYTDVHRRDKRAYRGFLSEVEFVMRNAQIPEAEITKFMNNFKVLSPREFIYLFNTSDLISRIFELADSPSTGGIKLNTTEADAKILLDRYRIIYVE